MYDYYPPLLATSNLVPFGSTAKEDIPYCRAVFLDDAKFEDERLSDIIARFQVASSYLLCGLGMCKAGLEPELEL